ncbi:MAG TPA: N-acetyltransferase, partial [Alteromonas mediterranea]|nr:N-acetyltransferase [Alteromonas mediterranea]
QGLYFDKAFPHQYLYRLEITSHI